MLSGFNFEGLPRQIPDNTDYLYDYLQYKDQEDMNKVKDAIEEFCSLTSEKMNQNKKQDHPILHEVCEQVVHNFELLKGLWKLQNLKPYWNNQNYTDKYGLTALERLSIRMHTLSNDKQNWIRENMKVNSFCDFDNLYSPSGNYNVKYIREHCNC